MWNVIQRRASLIREPNEVRILRLVRDRGVISRIEIAKATGLHKATVTDLVAKLIRAGFLEDTGAQVARKRVGRKRILLRFRPLAGIVAGVDIRVTSATVALTDLNARVLVEDAFDYPIHAPAQIVLGEVAATIERLLASGKYPRNKLVGIGIGVQGVIDYSTNTLVVSHNKKAWEGESLSALLESRFNVPVYVENDVKTMAVGEYLLGAAKGTKDFVQLWIGIGLGAGIMINGHLLHGITSSAGEIGFNSLDHPRFYRDQFPLTYTGQAMFGQILTDTNFVESYRRGGSTGEANVDSVAVVARRAASGDQVALRVIDEFTSLLSIICIGMVNLLNPQLILLGGKIAQHYPAVAGMLQERIHRDLLAPPAEAVRVQPSAHGERGVILGAASLVLYELFEPPHRVPARAAMRRAPATPIEVEETIPVGQSDVFSEGES
ncbi:MAG: ROK family transcriptional regulator [Bacteroidota bacterium]